ncbi:hypothetical protein B0H16DRAFT_1719155 [Mycena metata]|uniref:Uncharacterized protein n=1 Tax=Mycena metata TaxID=1033252 RepID=A0AAD7JCN8_9AGAR|nr:hypothetical protein B0H16DRAFT_1719155 [Mycena metata]
MIGRAVPASSPFRESPPQHPQPHDGHRYDPQQGQPQYAPQPSPGGYVPYPLPGTILKAPTGAPGAPGTAIQIVHRERRHDA